MKVELDEIIKVFEDLHGSKPRLFRAPGRVNLIGEHTDYNDGFVLPVAIEAETVVAAGVRNDRKISIYSTNAQETAEIDLDNPGQMQRGIWLDYVEGVVRSLQRQGFELRGANLVVNSTVPTGAGLSSSAAFEVSTGLAISSIAQLELEPITLALAGQEAEHTYVGAKVGIMDQFISVLGKKNHALLIDCRSFAAEPVPLDTSEIAVVICDSKVKHELSSSEYNTRRVECEQGIELLKKVLPNIEALRDVSFRELKKHQDLLPETIKMRCRHVVTENERTFLAAKSLLRGDLAEMGNFMFHSHESLRDDYEVSCRELDILVEIAKNCKGILGARMTGGGFGGCTVNLVKREALTDFRQTITKKYNELTGIETTIYVSDVAEGASEIIY